MKPIAYYLIGTGILTLFLQIHIIRDIQSIHTVLIVPLMWTPGIVAALCSYYFNFGFRDLALLKPGRRSMIYAYAVPAGVAVITLLILAAFGIGRLKIPESGLVRPILIEPILGVLAGLFLTIAEESGWRGYLYTHVIRAKIPHPALVVSALWTLSHWPLILFAEPREGVMVPLSLFLFTITSVSFSVFLIWLRERSRSVVPAVLAHAVHNTWAQTISPSFYQPGSLDPYFSGESGFVLAILYLSLAMYLYHRHPMGRMH